MNMVDTIASGPKSTQNITIKRTKMYGISIVTLIIIGILIGLIVKREEIQNELNNLLEICNRKLSSFTKESFSPTTVKTSSQPLVYTKNIKIAPANCKPYSGCFFPSNASNPINPENGKREHQDGVGMIWCEKSWRDCGAYQTCKNNKCVPK